MIAKRIEGETRALGAPADWDGETRCGVLPIRDVVCNGMPQMVSAWEPTPTELAALNGGETLKLWIVGNVHPPVAITVGPLE